LGTRKNDWSGIEASAQCSPPGHGFWPAGHGVKTANEVLEQSPILATQGGEPSLKPRNGQRFGLSAGQLSKGMQGVSWDTHPRRGQNFRLPFIQNRASSLIAWNRALIFALLKHWITEGTQVLLELEYIKLGSGGTKPLMLLIELKIREIDAFKDEIVSNKLAQLTQTSALQFRGQADSLVKLHSAGHVSGQV
jgi:hypothetical protein